LILHKFSSSTSFYEHLKTLNKTFFKNICAAYEQKNHKFYYPRMQKAPKNYVIPPMQLIFFWHEIDRLHVWASSWPYIITFIRACLRVEKLKNNPIRKFASSFVKKWYISRRYCAGWWDENMWFSYLWCGCYWLLIQVRGCRKSLRSLLREIIIFFDEIRHT
jgi:hypothetical protein